MTEEFVEESGEYPLVTTCQYCQSTTLDKEIDVAVEAVKLVISILKFHPDIL